MRKLKWGQHTVPAALGGGLQRLGGSWRWGGEPLPGAAHRTLRTAAARLLYRRIALLVALAIVLALLLPAAALLRVEEALGSLLPWLRGVPGELPHGDKVAPFGLFALWAVMLRLGWSEASWRSLVLKVLSVAVGTELLQLLVLGRTASVADLAADLAGGGLVFAVVYLWRQAGAARS